LSGFGAKAYSRLGLQTDVISADPYRMVLMLFDGALLSIRHAQNHLAAQRVAQRCEAIGLAIEIVDNLRVSVDPSTDPVLASRLAGLYRYVTMRLLQANLKRDAKALDETADILGQLRSAWVQIDPAARATVAAPRAEQRATELPAAVPAPSARRLQSAYQL
jgi:flagellar protein FliS